MDNSTLHQPHHMYIRVKGSAGNPYSRTGRRCTASAGAADADASRTCFQNRNNYRWLIWQMPSPHRAISNKFEHVLLVMVLASTKHNMVVRRRN